jgi:polyferredoxin
MSRLVIDPLPDLDMLARLGPFNNRVDLTMAELLQSSLFPNRWWHWIAVTFIAEILWFGVMYPLVPRTVAAAALEALLPLPLLGYLYLASRCLFWISKRPWSPWARRFLGVAIALSVGVVCFGIIAVAIVYTPVEFGYQPLHGS